MLDVIYIFRKRFFYSPIDVLDMVVIFASFAVDIAFTFVGNTQSCTSSEGSDYAK